MAIAIWVNYGTEKPRETSAPVNTVDCFVLSSRSINYDKTTALLSKIFNEMVNGTIPGSIFDSPLFFVYPHELFMNLKNSRAH